MRIGIVSDTHSHYRTVEAVVGLLRERGVASVLHCGDIEDAQTVRLFAGLPTHFVYGNCDSERAELRAAMEKTGAVLHEPFGSLELEGRQLAWTHGDNPRLLRELENSGFDFVFYGHTHKAERHQRGRSLVVNPGALYRARPRTFAVLDLASGELETIGVD